MGIYKSGRPLKYNPFSGTGRRPPAAPGEYRIRNIESGDITYIGETNNIARRIEEHLNSGKLSGQTGGAVIEFKIADGRSTSRTRREHERRKIEQHQPALNCSKGGEGRPAGR